MKTITNKDKFGEVFTPPKLAQEMRDLLFHDETREKINNMQLCKIFEPGSGQGIFFDIFQNLVDQFTNPKKRVFILYLFLSILIAGAWLILHKKKSLKESIKFIFNPKVFFRNQQQVITKFFLLINLFNPSI